MKIYTKTGDLGKTGLIGGSRVLKCDLRIESYGTVDELNSQIGFLLTFNHQIENYNFLHNIQHLLFSIGAHLATENFDKSKELSNVITTEDIYRIENEIDRLNSDLPELKRFILPGGDSTTALCHVCRTVARRCERRIVELNEIFSISNNVVIYINRLSDYFFVLSRFITINNGNKEIYWEK
jgi:cob(I)alamin adenosyltransferase